MKMLKYRKFGFISTVFVLLAIVSRSSSQLFEFGRRVGTGLVSKMFAIISPEAKGLPVLNVIRIRQLVEVRVDEVRSFFVFLRVKNGWIGA